MPNAYETLNKILALVLKVPDHNDTGLFKALGVLERSLRLAKDRAEDLNSFDEISAKSLAEGDRFITYDGAVTATTDDSPDVSSYIDHMGEVWPHYLEPHEPVLVARSPEAIAEWNRMKRDSLDTGSEDCYNRNQDEST